MKKVYIYEDFSGFDILLRDRELSEEEMYDPICDESRELLLVTDDIREMEPILLRFGFTPNTARHGELTREFEEILHGNQRRESHE